MADFPDVEIATSDPLDLAQGLPYLGSAFRAGISNAGWAETLFNVGATVLFFRMRASAFYEILIGLVGPAAALVIKPVHVTTSPDGTLTLDFSEATTKFQAGLIAGFTFGAGVQLSLDEHVPTSWLSPWKLRWMAMNSVKGEVKFDFIDLFIEVIKLLLGSLRSDGFNVPEKAGKILDSGILSTWSFLGDSQKEGLPGTLRATPKLQIPIDIVKYIPDLKAIDESLHAVKGELSFGPAVDIETPVSLDLHSFTVEGGQGPGSSADYGIINQNRGEAIVATGPAFTAVPTQLTTHVGLTTGFDLGISWYIKVSACKLFEFSVNRGVPDLLELLGLTPPTIATVHNSVSTELGVSSCVLVPGISLTMPHDPVMAATQVTGTVKLLEIPEHTGDSPLTIFLKSDPPVPGFPGSVQIAPGASPPEGTFHFTPPNSCVTVTDPDGTKVAVSPTPISVHYTVQVTATVQEGFETYCSTPLVVTQPLRVQNRIIEVSLVSGLEGEGPSWAPHQGSSVNSNPAAQPTHVSTPRTRLRLKWDGPPPPAAVPVTFRLHDEQGDPVASRPGPDPHLEFQAVYALPATVTISPADLTAGIEFDIVFSEKIGSTKRFSHRYVLSIDGGCSYGRNEWWISVWNWSGA